MRVMAVKHPWILLAGFLYHVAKQERVYPVIGIVVGLIKRNDHEGTFPQFLGKRFIKKLMQPFSGEAHIRVVAVVIHIWRVKRIGHQARFRILHEVIVIAQQTISLPGIDTDYAITPLLLYFLEAEKGHMLPGIITFFAF